MNYTARYGVHYDTINQTEKIHINIVRYRAIERPKIIFYS